MDYDLVPMDCRIPVMGGQEAVAEIRRLEGAARQTPIVSDDCGGSRRLSAPLSGMRYGRQARQADPFGVPDGSITPVGSLGGQADIPL